MRVHIADSKLVITTEPIMLHFVLRKYVDKNLKHEIGSIMKHNEPLAEHTIKI